MNSKRLQLHQVSPTQKHTRTAPVAHVTYQPVSIVTGNSEKASDGNNWNYLCPISHPLKPNADVEASERYDQFMIKLKKINQQLADTIRSERLQHMSKVLI